MRDRLLIVDDDEATCEFLAATLGAEGFAVEWETDGHRALERLRQQDCDAILTDLGMDGMGGLDLCTRVAQVHPDLPVVVVTGRADLESAVGAMRAGAFDYITKPVDTKLLVHQVRRAVGHRVLGREVRRLREALARVEGDGTIIGDSPAMRQVYDLVARVGPSDASVLVTGESGTGKELVARAVHNASQRSGAFVAINCAAVPASLIESELFGHVKGAFTDARRQRDGLFVQADGGTLFLDEIGELPLEMQPKLLRALQERRIRPVGSDEEIPFDARLVTATNRDLEAEVEAGRFREDLLYRIDVVRVELPPLRSRGRDILLLAQHFLGSHAERGGRPVMGISEGAAELLLTYDWPGNVRELENCMERAVALARYDRIAPDDLPTKVRDHRSDTVLLSAGDPGELLTLEQLEARYIRRVLGMVQGNKTQAAKVLGLDRRTLYRRLEKHGVQ
jgi:DNA-binding NtrC family response regulator